MSVLPVSSRILMIMYQGKRYYKTGIQVELSEQISRITGYNSKLAVPYDIYQQAVLCRKMVAGHSAEGEEMWSRIRRGIY
ncbi:hypothetical protein CY34DRAFT_805998 [Suillus luteus UH-Slu-Lm8-n1]|uniref:Uncharacterized protein n=1 Tax=Suillus luteus UH-Slu-Lm8-n1 TaxID=930992 RepID=A0A0D0B4U0_9AGAM|nr:hypothetical protein CY34DRAFT_805998 [Suillus luteus UH-Slu-Lm8-n1]